MVLAAAKELGDRRITVDAVAVMVRQTALRRWWVCVLFCLLLVSGLSAFLFPGISALGPELLIAAVLVLVVARAVQAPRAARRKETPLLGHLCWYWAVVLLLVGLAGVLGPSGLIVPGTAVMCAALGPLVLLGCAKLLSQGPLLPLATFMWRRRLGALLAAVAVPAAVIGVAAYAERHSAGYAMRYGRTETMGLPGNCEPNGDVTCSSGRLIDGGDQSSVLDDHYQTITVHFSEKGWSRYAHFYTPYGLGSYKPGDPNDPTGVTVDAKVVGHDAYVAIGYHPSALAPLGREPLPWLAWAVPPAFLIPLQLGWSARIRKKRLLGAAGATGGSRPNAGMKAAKAGSATRTGREERSRPYRLSVSSRRVRVTVEPGRFVVEQALTGGGGVTRWRMHMDLPWRDIKGMGFANDYRDPVVSLYVYPVRGTRRHALDASHLSAADWDKVADAVRADTNGRVTLDLSAKDGRWVNTDS
jgi:hypothetical protein